MAHQSKFVSVNLNKSYGRPTNQANIPSSYASSARARPGFLSGSSGGGGGGMVVLSRPRSSSSSSSAQKSSMPKLSVPPPLNLPSLRKESEKFDLSSVSGSLARPGSSGIGSGSGLSSMGWTKPAPAILPDKDAHPPLGSGNYMTPAARGINRALPSSSPRAVAGKAVFLRGEDFPALKATICSGTSKQKDLLSQKEMMIEDEREKHEFHSPLRMRPQLRSSRSATGSNTADGDERRLSRRSEQSHQELQEKYFPGLLPIVKLTHTSDWADDERDTGLILPERDRDRGFSRTEFSRDNEMGSFPSKELYKGESFGRVDSKKDGRDVTSLWRMPLPSQPMDDRVGSVQSFGASSEVNPSFNHSAYGGNIRNGLSNGNPDSRNTRRDLSFGLNVQNRKNAAEEFNGRGIEQHNMSAGHYGDLSGNKWYRGGNFQHNVSSKSTFSYGSKGLPLNDPILNFGREKKLNSSNTGKPYHGDPVFDYSDPFSDDPLADFNVKSFKKKKEMQKQDDFHDPVRESFEAELERVQRIQEQERQRVMEEQARAMELACREQEEREKLAREEDERRRLIEEEAREAVWRAEQERMETARRAEEQKSAREEEKRRMIMEEDRRKDAARKKLMELEARIARRQSEATQKDDYIHSTVGDERVHVVVNERDVPKVAADVGDWDDGERMVEHITSTSSDSSLNRYFDTGSSRLLSTRDTCSLVMERGKHVNYWKGDAYDNVTSSMFHSHHQESDQHSSRRDNFSCSSRGFPRKDSYESFGVAPMGPSSKGGSSNHFSSHDDLRYLRGNRCNVGGESDHFTRNLDADAADFLDNDRFADGGWGTGHPLGSPTTMYSERPLQNSEVDGGFPSYVRSRHSLRQPRVLPPPSVSSMRQSQSSFRGTQDNHISSFLDNQSRYHQVGQSGHKIMQSGYDGGYLERVQQPRTPEVLETDVISSEQQEKDSPRCDSQSSLSVSSPPSSPTQLSHDDLDDAEDSRALQTSPVEEQNVLFKSELVVVGMEGEHMNMMKTASSVSHEEEDEWEIENNGEIQQQEEYEEEEEGYQEEEEAVHEGEEEAVHEGGENLDLSQEFDDPSSGLPNMTGDMGQSVLGFDEGIEVSIPMDDDLEKTAGNLEKAVLDDLVGDHRLRVDDTTFTEGLISESSKIVSETEKVIQELALYPVTTSTSNPIVSAESVSVQGLSGQQPMRSYLSLPMPSRSTAQPSSSTVSMVDTQAESPIRLQFGLFSGPTLIPSPVPAIQIGSIQMPLHLHPQVGTSITQMHPPQHPFFHFGQLRYPSISQGILPMVPQTVSFVHSPPHAQYSSAENFGCSQNSQASHDSSSQNNISDELPAAPMEEHAGLIMKTLNPSKEYVNFEHRKELENAQKNAIASQGQNETRNRLVSGYQNVSHVCDFTSRKNYKHVINNRGSQGPLGDVASHLPVGEKAQIGTRVPGLVSSSRGRRFTYTARNDGTRLPFSMPENPRTDSNVFQRRPRRTVRRTEFRVRENVDKRQREGWYTSNSAKQVERPSFSGRTLGNSARYGLRRDAVSNKSSKTHIDSENINSGDSSSQLGISDGKAVDKFTGKEIQSKKRLSSIENSRAEDNEKFNVVSEEDFDAPIQSGVVRIFKQPGIEAPSDEDDFIEVRSKRQMLNDRREQREKEIKAKAKVIKAPRKHRSVPQSNAVISNSKKTITHSGGNTSYGVHSGHLISGGRGFASVTASPLFDANITSQPLAPIGTPSPKIDTATSSKNFKFNQANNITVPHNGDTKFEPGVSFDSKNTGLVNGSPLLGSWSNPGISQQVMALTQSQLDDAMKPVQFDSQVASSISLELTKASTSIVTHETHFLPLESPLNSLLAGQRIQFGAVTSPTILPPVSRDVSNGIVAPGSLRSDGSKGNSSTANDESTMFSDKEKFPAKTCTNLEDPEAEAEAAASAVAVAAISNNDDMVANRLGACSIQESKSLSSADNTDLKISAGVTSSQEVTGQLVAEESLSVALPADLSVDTTSIPLWHPLPSPQSTSGHSLSHFPGGPHSHFPMGFDMNPLFGGPFFAFAPHDESGGTHAQPQRSTRLGSGQLGAWTQCHSGVDSFNGPPAGFTGPYISPCGIPGAQAPPHMVVYNHFAPVGQFGQVGLSFMGTTYIPTVKQPDWKHNPVSSSTVGVSEGDINNTNFVSAQHNPPNMPSAIQHLAPGSPLMPIPSPLAMFDMSPFQSSAELPYQARWSHVLAPPIQSGQLTMPQQQQRQQLPQQLAGVMPSQFSGSLPGNTSTIHDRFKDHRPSPTRDECRSFSVSNDTNDSSHQIPGEHRLVDPPSVSTTNVQSIMPSYNSSGTSNSKSSTSSKNIPRRVMNAASETVGSSNGGQNAASSRHQVSQQQSASSNQQQYIHPIGHGNQRGASQKTTSTGEWHRRMGYQGKCQAAEKGFAPSKMKQIYVAKPPASGPPATG